MFVNDSRPPFTSLTLAAYGWSPANWSQVFYPDDLPPDWRLAYYANEFKRVLLPASGWVSPVAQAASWVAEVGQDFSFYLELTPGLVHSGHWGQVQEAVEHHLGAQLAGLLVEADAMPRLPPDWQERFAVHRLEPGQWLAGMPAGAEAQVGILRAAQALSPQALREVFEHLQQHTAHRDVVLFLDTPWVTLEQLRLMQQLYGV